jgi:nanoRNase/pAp phosphatase (c-di-AMP/oligoRNAs hydrolase)
MKQEARRYERLREVLAGARRVLVLTHDHPDPDALAAGLLLRGLLRHGLGLRADLGYGGLIGRAENRALVAALRIPLLHRSRIRFDRYDAIALVDTQPGTGNNALPPGRLPRVVFDHHPLRRHSREVPFCDVRPGYGAVTTILVEYLRAAGLPLDRRLATAIFHAIRSETQNLGRAGTPADARVFTEVFPLVDNRKLAQIEQAPFARDYLVILHRALRSARVHGAVTLTPLGSMPYPDAPAQIADFMLRVEGIRWALALGVHGRDVYLSLRAEDRRANAGPRLRRIVGERGRAGGHGPIAGGRITLPSAAAAVAEQGRLMRRARDVLGACDAPGKRFVPRPACPRSPRARAARHQA